MRSHEHYCPGGCGTRIDCDIIACDRCFPAVLVLGPFATPEQIQALVAARESTPHPPDGGEAK